VNVGVTSSGDVFGGTAVTFSDVLGDQQFNLYAASISQYRTLSLSYLNLERRFNWALQGYSQTQFFYGSGAGIFYDPQYAGIINRDLAIATQTIRGGTAFGIWPFNKYRRVEVFGGILNYDEQFNDPSVQAVSDQFQQDQFGRQLITSGTYVPLGVNYVQETTIFREFGPLAGNTVRVGYEVAPPVAGSLSRQRADIDARYYMRLGGSGLLAMRARSFYSWGQSPDFMYFGGNSEMRGYDYLSFVGNKSTFLNAELRFPFIEAMLTPVGVLGGIRGVFFANMGGASFQGQPFKWLSRNTEPYTPVLRYDFNPNTGIQTPIYGPTVNVSGLRLVDARASYGLGLETFALGFPIHFDWSWKTLMNKDWEDLRFFAEGAAEGKSGHEWFRQPRFQVWIGYDF
jgi:outer membrane protein assembly factor BamA